jgi:hypothetical protein
MQNETLGNQPALLEHTQRPPQIDCGCEDGMRRDIDSSRSVFDRVESAAFELEIKPSDDSR